MVARIPTLVHNGTTVMPYLSTDHIDDNIVGFGTYVVGPDDNLIFVHGVGRGETINVTNVGAKGVYAHPCNSLDIVDPADFHGHVNLTYAPPTPGEHFDVFSQPSAVILSMSEHTVDSYSYRNDMLNLWLGNKVVQTLSLTVHDPYGITVQKVASNQIYVTANTTNSHGMVGIQWNSFSQPLALHPVGHGA